jgi:hypothetical protein
MAANHNGGTGNKPVPPGGFIPIFCLMCCQFFKKGEQEVIAPALTYVPIEINMMWVAVPVCMDHLVMPSGSSLIH